MKSTQRAPLASVVLVVALAVLVGHVRRSQGLLGHDALAIDQGELPQSQWRFLTSSPPSEQRIAAVPALPDAASNCAAATSPGLVYTLLDVSGKWSLFSVDMAAGSFKEVGGTGRATTNDAYVSLAWHVVGGFLYASFASASQTTLCLVSTSDGTLSKCCTIESFSLRFLASSWDSAKFTYAWEWSNSVFNITLDGACTQIALGTAKWTPSELCGMAIDPLGTPGLIHVIIKTGVDSLLKTVDSHTMDLVSLGAISSNSTFQCLAIPVDVSSDSYSTSLSDSVSSSTSESISKSSSYSLSTSDSVSSSTSVSESSSQSASQSLSESGSSSKSTSGSLSTSVSSSESSSVSESVSHSTSHSGSISQSNSQSKSQSTSQSNSQSMSESNSESNSQSTSASTSKSMSESNSESNSHSTSTSKSTSYSTSISHSTSLSHSHSTSDSESTSNSVSESLSIPSSIPHIVPSATVMFRLQVGLPGTTIPPGFSDNFRHDVASALGIPESQVDITDYTTISEADNIVVVSVDYQVDVLNQTDVTVACDDLIDQMEFLVNDTDSTLYQGDVTQYTDPTSLDVVDVQFFESYSSSASSSQNLISSGDVSISVSVGSVTKHLWSPLYLASTVVVFMMCL
ncbi:hypothetical protein Pelo_10760 [Pelomyxa schiedti]|nr:hypothetical protein Pelo_10760 [Pelomyxa schiedti]